MRDNAAIKVYVKVKVDFNAEGIMLPREIIWEDGEHYAIDRVLDIQQAAARRAGGQGDCYTIRVNGRETYLFFKRSTNLTGPELGRWSVERRTA